jgi:PAS domain S-box-containing protein
MEISGTSGKLSGEGPRDSGVDDGLNLREFADHLRDPVFILDPGDPDIPLRILYVNPAVRATHGYEPQELIGKSMLESLDTEQTAALAPERLARILSGQTIEFDAVHRRKDGSLVTLQVRATRIVWQGRIAVMGIDRDVTEMTRIHDKLQRVEERCQLALDGAGDVVWDWDMVHNKVEYSSRWKSMLGYADHEVGDTFADWAGRVHPQDLPGALQTYEAYLKNPTGTYTSEFRMRCRNGSYRWILSRGKAVRHDAQGNALRIVGTHSDVTNRKLVLATREFLVDCASRFSDERYFQAVAEHIAVTLGMDHVLIIERLDEGDEARCVAIHPQGSIGSKPPLDLRGELWKQLAEATMLCVKDQAKRDYPHDAVLEQFDANSMVGVPLRGSKGRIIGFIAAMGRKPLEDVEQAQTLMRTIRPRVQVELERLETQRKLRETQMLWQEAFENGPLGAAILAPDLSHMQSNQAWRRLTGHTAEELLQRTLKDLTHADDQARIQRLWAELTEGKSDRIECEWRYLRKDGAVRLALLWLMTMRDAAGRVRYFLSKLQDVTERNQIEDQLRESEARWRQLFDQSPVPSAVVGMDFRFWTVNDALCRFTGYSAHELEGGSYLNILHPEEVELGAEAIRTLLEQPGHRYERDARCLRKDGQVVWGRLSLAVIRDAEGRPTCLVPKILDITVRKHAEERLRESEARLAAKNQALQEVLDSLQARQEETRRAVLASMESVVLPQLEALQRRLPRTEEPALQRIVADLKEITLPFVGKLGEGVSRLTPTEIRVAVLIRRGLSVKQIAAAEKISDDTVAVHRRSIRRKLGITHSKINLRTYLEVNLNTPDLPR